MLYRMHYATAPGIGPSFGIVVDDATMTWTSDPPGHDINQPVTGYFTRGGPIGSGKQFQVCPGGKASEIK